MSQLRYRKPHREQGNGRRHNDDVRHGAPPTGTDKRDGAMVSKKRTLGLVLGCLVGIASGLCHAKYLDTLHENELWFSNIQEVEREISFRTECGLYYSYYKQLLQAPSFLQGIRELVYDNRTESLRTINLLQRMNIYQEVIMGLLYCALPLQGWIEPVYFYIHAVFQLQGLYVVALHVTAWLLSGTWLAGLLAATWFTVNRLDTTRAEFTVSLRENWALPFLACQVAAVTCYLRPNLKLRQERPVLAAVWLSTFVFSLAWQFNQFVLLIQALALYGLRCLQLAPARKVDWVLAGQTVSMLLVCLLQFLNPMILGSLTLSFLLATFLARRLQPDLEMGGFWRRISCLALHLLIVTSLTLAINFGAKVLLQLQSDEHIFKFLKAKFGLGNTRDFDAKLYLCEDAFGWLPPDTFVRLSRTAVFPVYMLALAVCGIGASAAVFRKLRGPGGDEMRTATGARDVFLRPDLLYNLAHTLLFFLLALSTMRMKYLWTSHMCVFAAFAVSDTGLWAATAQALGKAPEKLSKARYVVPALLLLYTLVQAAPRIRREMGELREFYDPDTVDLMNWIKQATPPDAVFAGTMQLMAGVKLCTGRVLTNHPHYEDKTLRERTLQVYQVYARRSPAEVHAMLLSLGAHYVVLEDSVCYERRHGRGCRLRDLLDVANGQVMEGEGPNDADLTAPTHGRFCHEIKAQSPAFARQFRAVFSNNTFHVYRILHPATPGPDQPDSVDPRAKQPDESGARTDRVESPTRTPG
ncbi:protein C-mannosyl-transferase DPY19L3 [Petromyzon marinus]|uniref:protein C-mannosyl-transferase DPY19L3 n=1 Tax=Petromyzon marinus TaxID=7757 RepID=UPI003F71F827